MAMPDAQPDAAKAVAVIDIGANSVRMVIAQVWPDRHIEVLERVRRPVRLGHDTFRTNRLGQQAMNAAIGILRDCNDLLHTYRVEVVRAVATSAVREAANADAFVDRVAMAVGLDLDVLDPTEESRLTVSAVRQAVREALDLDHTHALIVEAGGGSMLITMLEGGAITASESYALGSIRLQERLSTARAPQDRAVDMLRHQIGNVVDLIRRSMPLDEVRSFIAVGEDARFAVDQVGQAVPGAENVYTVELEAFDRLVEACVRHTPEQLSRAYSLPFPSAERLVPALLIYHALLHATRAERKIVCTVSMRDGLLLDLARLVTGEEDHELAESIVQSARTIGEKYRVDPNHAEHVANLSVRLFDELQKEHGLSTRYRLLLRVAGIVHETGKFVSNRAHHKHSYYVVANSEVFGLSRADLQVVAHVARYHRRSAPKPTHLEYMTLPREQRIAVNKLASMLRVADCLDRGHAQQVRDFDVVRRPGELLLYVRGVVDLTVERRALVEKADLFEETFGLNVRLEEAASPLSDIRRASPVE